MKLNREKIAATLALLIFALGMSGVVRGLVKPVRGITVPETAIPRSTRDNIPRRYRTFVEEGEPARNPFSFSEGWQRMESTPLPLLSPGASALEARLPWTDKLPAVAKEEE